MRNNATTHAQQHMRFPQLDLCHFVWEFVISPKYSGIEIIADTPTQINWLLKIQNTACVYVKFPPLFSSPLHSTRSYIHKVACCIRATNCADKPRTTHTSHKLACCIRSTNYARKEACCIRVTNSMHKLAVLQPFVTSSLPTAISSHVTNWRVTNYVHELATWRLESYNLSSLAPSPQRFRAMHMSHELCIPVTNYVSESRTMYTRHELTSHGLCTRTTYTSHELCEWTCELAHD